MLLFILVYHVYDLSTYRNIGGNHSGNQGYERCIGCTV